MIARLVAADLRTEPAVWWGAFLVAVAAAIAATVPALLISTGLAASGVVSYALLAIAGTVIAVTTVAVMIVESSVMRATVEFRRETFALWLTAGVLPAQVGAIVLLQLAAVAVVGSAVGAGIGGVALPTLVHSALAGSTGLGESRIEGSPVDLIAVVVAVTIIVVLAAIPAAHRAATTPPLQLLHATTQRRCPRGRWIIAIALLAVAIQMASSLPSAVGSGGGAFLLLGAVLVSAASVGGQRLVTRSAELWMRLIPRSSSVAFSIARARVTRAGDDAAAIIPFFVAIALPSTFFASTQIAAYARGETPASGSLGATGLILGGPVLLAAVGGAASIAMAVRAAREDSLLLAAIGAPAGTIRRVQLWVAVQVVVTASLLALAVELVLQSVEVGVLVVASAPARPSSDVRPLVVVIAASFVLALLAAMVTSRSPTKGPAR